MSIVLLCAEEDDLDLIGLAHIARQRGFDIQVVPGAGEVNEPVLFTLLRERRALFVVVESEHLPASRVTQLREMFDDVRVEAQHFMVLALALPPERAIGLIQRRMVQLGLESEQDASIDWSSPERTSA